MWITFNKNFSLSFISFCFFIAILILDLQKLYNSIFIDKNMIIFEFLNLFVKSILYRAK